MTLSRSTRRFLVIATPLAVVIAFIALLCSTAGPFRAVTGKGVTADEANRRLWQFRVPDDATDVWYTSGYRATRVECTLSPESFHAWCNRNGWRTRPLDGTKPEPIYSLRDDFPTITHGLKFDEMQGDLGCWGFYDLITNRAYVGYTGG